MRSDPFRRRTFILGSASLLAAAGCDSTWSPVPHGEPEPLTHVPGNHTYAFRLSTRGRRAPRAVKQHAANKRFATWQAAEAAIPYSAAPVRVVRITVSKRQYERWFTERDTVDLRPLPRTPGAHTLKG